MAAGFNKILVLDNSLAENPKDEFVPEHIRLNIQPQKSPYLKQATKQPAAIVPYYNSEQVDSMSNTTSFPNSGNNQEFTWMQAESSDVNEYNDMAEPAEGEVINYIDNNEYVNCIPLEPDSVQQKIVNEITSSPNDDCILFIDGNFVLKSTQSFVENQVSKLIYGDSDLVSGAIEPERIEVFKKLKLKIGVFLE